MTKPQLSTSMSGLRLGQNGDFLASLTDQSSHGASGWATTLASDAANRPTATLKQFEGQQEIIFLNPHDWSEMGYAKGGSPGGGGSKPSGYVPPPIHAGADGAYNITVEFKGTYWTSALAEAFSAAATQICEQIIGDIPDVLFRGRLIDDIVITAELKAIDGVNGILGQAGPTAIRTGTYLPAAAKMEFDIDDAEAALASDEWDDIILHEMMHSIGFGTIWDYKNLVKEDTTTPELDYFYTGYSGSEVYGQKIPVEGGDIVGTSRSHWDEDTFGDELMTGYIDGSTHIDPMTWASLADLGYKMVRDPLTYGDVYAV